MKSITLIEDAYLRHNSSISGSRHPPLPLQTQHMVLNFSPEQPQKAPSCGSTCFCGPYKRLNCKGGISKISSGLQSTSMINEHNKKRKILRVLIYVPFCPAVQCPCTSDFFHLNPFHVRVPPPFLSIYWIPALPFSTHCNTLSDTVYIYINSTVHIPPLPPYK